MTEHPSPQLIVPLSLSAVLASSLLLLGCSSREAEVPAARTTPIAVTTAKVALADVADVFEAGGVVQASTTATITARLLASVRDVRVSPGDRVRAGQTLVVLDNRDLAAQARSARSAVLAAEQSATASAAEQQAAAASLLLARSTHERIAGLHAKRSATAQELDDATGALRAAEARLAGASARAQAALSAVDSGRAASEAASTTESFTVITAPFDGTVTDKMVEVGNMAAPGLPLLRVEDTRAFRLEVRVDESRVGLIALGLHVPVSLDSGSGGTPTTVNGTVAEIGRAVDADSRAFLVKVALPDGTGLRSGLFGRVQFRGAPRRALTLPPGSLIRHGQMASVFVVEQGIARVRFVNVSESEVLAGLAADEVVVVGAPPRLTDGTPVTEGGR